VICKYSQKGSGGLACVTAETTEWWERQKPVILLNKTVNDNQQQLPDNNTTPSSSNNTVHIGTPMEIDQSSSASASTASSASSQSSLISITPPSISSRWSSEATKAFKSLYNERDGKWSYLEFTATWDKHKHGEVTQHMWNNKNLTIRRQLQRQQKNPSEGKRKRDQQR